MCQWRRQTRSDGWDGGGGARASARRGGHGFDGRGGLRRKGARYGVRAEVRLREKGAPPWGTLPRAAPAPATCAPLSVATLGAAQ